MELAVAASVSSSFTLSVDGGVTVLDVQETQIGDFGAIKHKMWCYKTYLVRWMLVFFGGDGGGCLWESLYTQYEWAEQIYNFDQLCIIMSLAGR